MSEKSIAGMIQKLDNRIVNFKKTLDDQMIALKYGKDYKHRFIDNIIIEVEKL